jgi:error-prone DNA polymerase
VKDSAARRAAHRLLAIYDLWQREGEVKHLVANRLVDISNLLSELPTASRNFH